MIMMFLVSHWLYTLSICICGDFLFSAGSVTKLIFVLTSLSLILLRVKSWTLCSLHSCLSVCVIVCLL